MSRPVFYLLAGPNGAGKSTLYRAAVAEGLIPSDVEFVNADLYEAAHLQHLHRVAQRVREGGHGVPAARILARYPRTLQHLRQGCQLADMALFYDTSAPAQGPMQPHRLVARCRSGQVVWQAADLPHWVTHVLL